MCTCEEALELISASLDGVLSKEEEQLLHEHLSQCPACRDLLADLEKISRKAHEQTHFTYTTLEEITALN